MDLMVRRRQLMAMQKSELPSEYRRVKYIEGDGTQYIDSGIYPGYGDSLSITFSSTSRGDKNRPFGAYSPGVAVDGYDGFRVWTNGALQATGNIGDGNVNTISCVDNNWYLNGNLALANRPTYGRNDITISLFKARYANNMLYGDGIMKLYGFSYARDGNNIMNLIPCTRKADNKPGMYDTVSKTFFTNAGTGEFIVPN